MARGERFRRANFAEDNPAHTPGEALSALGGRTAARLAFTDVPALSAPRTPAPPATRPRPLGGLPMKALAPQLDAPVAPTEPPGPADLAPTVTDPAAAARLDTLVSRAGRDPHTLFRYVHDRVFPGLGAGIWRLGGGGRAGEAAGLVSGRGGGVGRRYAE